MNKVTEIQDYLTELDLKRGAGTSCPGEPQRSDLSNWLYLENLLDTEMCGMLAGNIEVSVIRNYFQVTAYFNYYYFTQHFNVIESSLDELVEISKKSRKLSDWLLGYSLLQASNIGVPDRDVDALKQHAVLYIKQIRPVLLQTLAACIKND